MAQAIQYKQLQKPDGVKGRRARSWYSIASCWSVLCLVSVLGAGSVFSLISIGSVGSVFSIGSVASILSVASVGCFGRLYTDCSQPYSQYNTWYPGERSRETRAVTPACKDRKRRHRDGALTVVSRTHLRFKLEGKHVGCGDVDGGTEYSDWERERTEVKIGGVLPGNDGRVKISYDFRLSHTHNDRYGNDAECELLVQVKCSRREGHVFNVPPMQLWVCPHLGIGLKMRNCSTTHCDPGYDLQFRGGALLPPDYDQGAWYHTEIVITMDEISAQIDGQKAVGSWDGECGRSDGPTFKIGLYRKKQENASYSVMDVKNIRVSPNSNRLQYLFGI